MKGAIVESVPEKGEFISTIFIVAKPNGKFRPVINLKYLNEFVHYDHFKQETFKVVLDLLQKDDFLAKIDMRDAYFSVPIDSRYQKYLKFSWNGILYKFVCLPFGLKSSPYLFTKILKPVYANFRQQNTRCSYYIDDSLNMSKHKDKCESHTVLIADSLQSLGFTVNTEKSVMVPTQRIVFFGFVIDTIQFKIFLTQDKVQKLVTSASRLIEKGVIKVRDLASFIGLVINAFYAVFEAPMHYRNLERDKIRALGPQMNFDNELCLSMDGKDDLQWWIRNVSSVNGKMIRQRPAQIHCRTDASFAGWGAVDLDDDKSVNGRWHSSELCNSINFLELMAIWYALQSLYDAKHDVNIEIQSDNISAIKYINDMGGMTSKSMDSLAKSIWEWCIQRNIFVVAMYIPGVLNTADYLSRNFSDSTEWMLKKDIFIRICKQFFVPDIDLFASRLNRQVDDFVSWFPEPGSMHTDAFTLCWQGYMPYIFPPFNLVGRVINKIVEDRLEKAIIVIPFWKSQSWFPVVLDCISSFPVRLPRHKDLLCLPHDGSRHPLSRSMRIIAVEVSGMRYRAEAFRQQLRESSSVRGKTGLDGNTNMRGTNGWFGIDSGLAIPFKRLKL